MVLVSVRTRIVLGTLCTWNGGLLFALGVIALLYVDGLAGKTGAVLFWVAGWSLFALARRLRRATDW
jgi:hypothetical protein